MMEQQSKMDFMSDMEVKKQSLTLADRFVVPPFSILDTRQGYWQDRKRQWLSLGIQSEVGRGENDKSAPGGSLMPAMDYSNKQRGDGKGRAVTKVDGLLFRATGFMADVIEARGGGTSIFDPVLCEIMYKWFCPVGGKILDPFAGGSVRAIVAETLSYKYTGIEIRQEQIDANLVQSKALNLSPSYILGDSTKLLELLPQEIYFDMIFTCPPYYDLEVYSDVMDNMGDMSVYHSYFSFMIWYELIFKQAVSRLKNNRFLCVVVGDIRDKDGIYRGFVADNILLFSKLGLKFYNEAILVTAVGSLPVRVANQFPSGRKLGKSHQNVLVFYKGNVDKIKDISFIDKIDRIDNNG